jgi:hypothetical protein
VPRGALPLGHGLVSVTIRRAKSSVREALAEMKDRKILANAHPFDEKLVRASTKGRPKITDAVWTLYPSGELVEEIIDGNREMTSARIKAGGNKRVSRLLPGFADVGAQGEISANGSNMPLLTGGIERVSRPKSGESNAKVPPGLANRSGRRGN